MRTTIDRGRVKRLIEGQGLKQWWVAEAAGIHKTTLRRWLKGEIGSVDEDRAKRLAAVLGAPVAGPGGDDGSQERLPV